jgi:hypothetical protein
LERIWAVLLVSVVRGEEGAEKVGCPVAELVGSAVNQK